MIFLKDMEDSEINSRNLAREFGVKNIDIVRMIDNLIPKMKDFVCFDLKPKYNKNEESYRSRKFKTYNINKDLAFILAIRLDTKKARKWQGLFLSAFNTMENHISDKEIARKEETDVIKDFVEYATNQGSKSAKFYYKHITNATYKALGLISQKKPKLRDMMNIYEIAELMLAERVARNSIKKYMELGRHYKDIYESVKDDLVAFSSGLKIGND